MWSLRSRVCFHNKPYMRTFGIRRQGGVEYHGEGEGFLGGFFYMKDLIVQGCFGILN